MVCRPLCREIGSSFQSQDSVIALAKDWDRMLSTASSPIPNRTRQGLLPAKEPWIDLKSDGDFAPPQNHHSQFKNGEAIRPRRVRLSLIGGNDVC